MSAKHLLDAEGVVVCGATPSADGSNTTSTRALASCLSCLGKRHGRVEIKMQRIYVAVDNETNQEIGRSTDFTEASRLAGILPAGHEEV